MRRTANPRAALAPLALALAAAGCVTVEAPGAPDITIEQTGGGGSSTCACDAATLQQRVFRFTRLEIDEPAALAPTLNSMWTGELQSNKLNVLFRVLEAEAGTGVAFERLTLQTGPGWREPVMPYDLPPEYGQPTESAVTSYCLLDGMDVQLELEPYHGYQCQLKTSAPGSLLFHLGPKTGPLVCSPTLDQPNTTPIQELTVRFGFNEDCSAIDDGYLEGCIVQEEANRICMCLIAGTCSEMQDPSAAFDPDDLSGYCKDACGSGWISFGSIIKSFRIQPSCLTPSGEPGMRLQGFFDAVDVGSRFNPVQSDDCSVH